MKLIQDARVMTLFCANDYALELTCVGDVLVAYLVVSCSLCVSAWRGVYVVAIFISQEDALMMCMHACVRAFCKCVLWIVCCCCYFLFHCFCFLRIYSRIQNRQTHWTLNEPQLKWIAFYISFSSVQAKGKSLKKINFSTVRKAVIASKEKVNFIGNIKRIVKIFSKLIAKFWT